MSGVVHRIDVRSWRRLWLAYCVCGIRWPCPDADPDTTIRTDKPRPVPRPDGSWPA